MADEETPTQEETGHGFTVAERKVLDHLVAAWNAFVELGTVDADDVNDFRKSINDAERIIASNIAGRVEPGVWRN